jgi:hypothetical protein
LVLLGGVVLVGAKRETRKEIREMTSLLGAVLRRGKVLAERSTSVEAQVVVIMLSKSWNFSSNK